MNRASAIEQIKILDALIRIAEVSKLLSTFISAFEKGILKEDGIYYLHGNLNLGGARSGRMSSNDPNLMNIPSTGNKIYAKLIKQCFKAPPGYLMVGVDFNSLEDMISALTTNDPNKLKVYLDGYDGHCLRAYSYFRDQMLDIPDTLEGINSIEVKYAPLRQESKGPTFALTYQGTWHTLVNQIGLPKEKAKEIEHKYHELYKVSDQWVQDKLQQASDVGYVTIAFGLRLRTPILNQVLFNRESTPYEAQAEGRTAGNALGQSYGLLNNRASIEFQEKVLASKFKYDIKPITHIHDAQYFIIKNTIACVEWFNNNIIKCMQWQELPEIQHDIVKLGGEMEIFYPTWADPIKIKNRATRKEILNKCRTKRK